MRNEITNFPEFTVSRSPRSRICRSSSSVSSRIDAVISRMREISICVCPTDDANGYDMVMEWVFPVSRSPHCNNDVQMEMTNKEIE